MAGKEQVLKLVEDQLCRRVVVALYLVAYHLYFLVKLCLRIGTVEHNVSEQRDGTFDIVTQHRSVIDRVFLRRKGIQVAANTLQFIKYLQRGAFLCPFKRGMLHKVSHAFLSRQFVARSCSYGITAIHHLLTGSRQVYDAQSVRECLGIVFHLRDAKVQKIHHSSFIIVHHYSFLTEFTTFGSLLFYIFADKNNIYA